MDTSRIISMNKDLGCTMEFDLPWKFLEDITNSFSEEHIIGTGGYGIVYKGVSTNGEEIAVKRLRDMPGLDQKQFENEIQNLRDLRHENIVWLVGKSYEEQDRCVPYNGKLVVAKMINRAICLEYLHNGSLEKHLSDEFSGLPWHGRYKIIKGISEGLKYLHEHGIYHLDLKPPNVLLDKDMVPKITDFGLSRLFCETRQSHTTHNFPGTPGYMPPEYIEKGKISEKFDIFSLGRVIIEILTGSHGYSRYSDMSCHDFVLLVYGNWRKRLEEELEDKSYLDLFSQQVKTCMEIAVTCVERDRNKRPSIGDIVRMLNNQILDVQPLYLCYPSEHDKQQMSCPLQLTNKSEMYALFRIRPKRAEIFADLLHGVVPPRSTCTYVLTMRVQYQSQLDLMDGYLIESSVVNEPPNALCGVKFSNLVHYEVNELTTATVSDLEGWPTFEIISLEKGPITDAYPLEQRVLTNDDEGGIQKIKYSAKKIVLKVDFHDKDKKKAFRALSALDGIDEVSVDTASNKMTVMGLVDPIALVGRLRKSFRTQILAVGPVKEKVQEGTRDEDRGQQSGISRAGPAIGASRACSPRPRNSWAFSDSCPGPAPCPRNLWAFSDSCPGPAPCPRNSWAFSDSCPGPAIGASGACPPSPRNSWVFSYSCSDPQNSWAFSDSCYVYICVFFLCAVLCIIN